MKVVFGDHEPIKDSSVILHIDGMKLRKNEWVITEISPWSPVNDSIIYQ